jgi:regulator of sigma E protease
MINWLIGGAGIVVVFGIVVFVHELGHFLAAKAVGVYAPRFSIGFGPALWRWRRGETEYVIAALPLGGYVRMASRHDDATAWIEGGGEGGSESAVATVGADGAAKLAPEEYPEGWDPNAMRPFGPKPIPEHRWFESKPLPARLVILLSGVAMNILLTFVLITGIFATNGRSIVVTRVVGGVDTLSGPGAALLAIQPGDTIARVDGTAAGSWDDIVLGILRSTGPELRIETQRGVTTVPVGGAGQPSRADVARALEPYRPNVIGEVIPGTPAARAGIQAGDTVVAVDGRTIDSFSALVREISPAPGRALRLSIRREGGAREIVVRPDSTRETPPGGGASRVVGRIGAAPHLETRDEPIAFGEAVQEGWNRTWEMGGLIFTTLRQLATREVPLSELGGPGTIAIASAQAAQAGVERLLGLIALLSINVAIFNLLPIPLLDGGQILLNIVETAKGSEFSPRTREYILRIGLAAILILFAIVLFNDTSRFVDLIRGIWN